MGYNELPYKDSKGVSLGISVFLLHISNRVNYFILWLAYIYYNNLYKMKREPKTTRPSYESFSNSNLEIMQLF